MRRSRPPCRATRLADWQCPRNRAWLGNWPEQRGADRAFAWRHSGHYQPPGRRDTRSNLVARSPCGSVGGPFVTGDTLPPARVETVAPTTRTSERFDSGVPNLDRVLGGGLLRGTIVMVSGPP